MKAERNPNSFVARLARRHRVKQMTKEADAITTLAQIGAHSLMTPENFPHIPPKDLQHIRMANQASRMENLMGVGATDELKPENFPDLPPEKLADAYSAAKSNELIVRLQIFGTRIGLINETLEGVEESETRDILEAHRDALNKQYLKEVLESNILSEGVVFEAKPTTNNSNSNTGQYL